MSNKARNFFKEEVKFVGVFNYSDFFSLLYNFVTANGYTLMDDSHAQKEGDTGTEVEVMWKFERRIDDYTKFHIVIYYLIKDMKDVIIKKPSGEVKTNEGNCYIRINGIIETDWQNRWELTKWIITMRDFYERYLLKPVIDDYIVKVSMMVGSVAGELKTFFNMVH